VARRLRLPTHLFEQHGKRSRAPDRVFFIANIVILQEDLVGSIRFIDLTAAATRIDTVATFLRGQVVKKVCKKPPFFHRLRYRAVPRPMH
jgi:hypothetical protein